ncbi:hypothetical protein [Saccharopolyspora hattusasensis]|uniref:hypothetical protein n=1 Tax=Saccharopolyspora hattusasensis TaxID=1128679 RepID=UPI003D954F12
MNAPVPFSPAPIPPIAPMPRECNHTLHLILSLVTCGFWLFVWPFVAFSVSSKNKSAQARYAAEMTNYQREYALWAQSQGSQR